jgi:hypothetical protein
LVGFSYFFVFLLPMMFIFLALRVGTSLFRSMNRRDDSDFPRWEGDDRFLGGYGGYRHLGMGQGNLEARVFKLANRRKGRITVSDVVIETGLGVHEAEELLQSMVDNVRVTMEVTDDGMVLYEFPEILKRFEDDADG